MFKLAFLKLPVFIALFNDNNEGFENAIVDALQESLEAFFGVEILAGTLPDVARTWEQDTDVFEHLRKILQPGVLSNIEKTLPTINEEYTPYGTKRSLANEAGAWLSFLVKNFFW